VTSPEFAFKIDVPVRNEWSNVGLLVTSVQNCFNAMFADVDGSHTVAMVTGELLENAIKYGAWTRSGQHLRLSVAGGTSRARISVENPAEEADVADLERALEWTKGHVDAESAYRARLLAIAQSTDPDVSKLGIVRIAHEGRCTIEAAYVDGVIRVTAEMRFSPVERR